MEEERAGEYYKQVKTDDLKNMATGKWRNNEFLCNARQ